MKVADNVYLFVLPDTGVRVCGLWLIVCSAFHVMCFFIGVYKCTILILCPYKFCIQIVYDCVSVRAHNILNTCYRIWWWSPVILKNMARGTKCTKQRSEAEVFVVTGHVFHMTWDVHILWLHAHWLVFPALVQRWIIIVHWNEHSLAYVMDVSILHYC